MKKWISIFSLSAVTLAALLGVNEWLLTKAGHLKTVVSDADLWALEREKVDDLGEGDMLLLGASRMQVNIDLAAMRKEFPGRQVLQLALSGRGSALPVLEDIVTNTDFRGTIIVDESQASLSNPESQQDAVVRHYHRNFSLDRKVNKLISIWMQERFLFVNPNSNSERLWGNLVSKRQLPPPMFTMTYANREQTSYFDLTDTEWIYQMRIRGVRQNVSNKPADDKVWLEKAMRWKKLVTDFQQKGGKILFVHMPFSQERWQLENKWMPRERYWDRAMAELGVPYIHFDDYPQLQKFKVPDTSHLASESKTGFTQNLSAIIRTIK